MTTNQEAQVEDQLDTECRALVANAAPASAAPRHRQRHAPFLAQLIATAQDHPQTRARRRAEPAQAVTAYRAMARLAKWG